MPVATSDGTNTKRFDLKTAPPDGYVVVRRLTYGEYLTRRQMTSNMKLEGGKGKDFEALMQLMSEKATEYEFANCIVEHNLTDEKGRQLDFRLPADIRSLDTQVGQEINACIDELNQFEEEVGNSQPESEPKSSLDSEKESLSLTS